MIPLILLLFLAAAIVEGGGRAFGAACDVTKESDLVASVDRAVAEFGSLVH
jgi:NAD(P)-dependent dehydrogenase (short-subunit alcohol dehydrogenase family)